ncbi:type II toxin-antitoxin system HipA family toxin [Thiothrix subterranea]|uniref:Type II toxin-antitoxin system HipA family toxin n=1 Tax=Thiothrix subterranea TaxID=2735563 RepID=A0AA51MNB0_9GAMM|nr:type II toxin-antitoxin system HipA family toxin [Thiothrix subterranea]MDQ5767665.1 type II toxin-antitoxin system HipA family toxin [Thiothrix subterranea]WML85472.1 type II toxin-antitoxin system HipA family toxin [Thiothrix subterranea]
MTHKAQASVLALHLHGCHIAYLTGFAGGRNIITFTPSYLNATERPTFTLPQLGNPKLFDKPWTTQLRLHPVLSNLLPEGALREWVARNLKIHPDNEFPLLAWLGNDLPGALIATPVDPLKVPDWVLAGHSQVAPLLVPINQDGQRFSLAGVQMKFSGRHKDGRYHISQAGELGNWIIKTPSTLYPGVPSNEYTCMTLAQLAGVTIPDIRLLPLADLEGLPAIQLPAETHAYAIRRFDRDADDERIHTEDFAQILQKYPHEKYHSSNYEMLGRILQQFSADSTADLQQLARRLLVNILLGNGDAHLKNWTVIYPDQINPQLAPAYDILYTQAYITGETQAALNMGDSKDWYKLEWQHFQRWAKKVGISWALVETSLYDTLERARNLWPAALQELPMLDVHKTALHAHWQRLNPAWRIT